MASNYTSDYNLCQWEADDKVLRSEFNEDNRKIDAALGALASSVSGKASSSALNSLQTTVNGLKTSKADKSVVDSLSQTVSQHTAELAKKGNCQVYATSYVGTGRSGAASALSLTFPKKPMAVFIGTNTARLFLFQGMTYVRNDLAGDGVYYVHVSWSGNSVSWYSSSYEGQMNVTNATYQVIALLQVD